MDSDGPNKVDRRRFLKQAGLAVGATALAARAGAAGKAAAGATRVSLVIDPADPVASAAPAKWAVEQLRQALAARRIECRLYRQIGEAAADDLCIEVAGHRSALPGGIVVPDAPEALAIARGKLGDRKVLFARGTDVRGLVYALTELADISVFSDDALSGLRSAEPITERPANAVRSCMRMFCSDVEDKAWFNDREFWKSYLSMLIAQRFNRFHLCFGLGYDFTREIRDAYLHFAYPFLVKVPGYDVRATNLSDAERGRNLEMLRFISDEAARRGLHFQLGLWTHAYEWTESPEANHRIEGLRPETQAAYCRDALAILLRECPNIAGVTIRTHGESGVGEGNYELWRQVFDGVVRSGRRLEIDLHAKGLDRTMIETALATGLPVTLSPKFWAEHMGLPYHQAWIRPTELPQRVRGEGLFALSSGSRSFLRYGYGDLLEEGRRYSVLHRIWPGTQRLLLWGDPVFAAAYGRESSFCGSAGAEIMEPLSFKGRKGSGREGHRTALADPSLQPRYDFERYLYTYRLWGRLLFNPETRPDAWQRLLRSQHGAAAPAVEAALSASSRILPLVTTAHTPSAANNHWWPEMYVNMSIVDASRPQPFTDTPEPKRFGAVSPLDPQLFARVVDFADDLIKGRTGGPYTPAEVAAALDDLAASAAEHLATARSAVETASEPGFRRFALDVAVQIDLGRFFAHKLRAAVLYALFERSGDPRFLGRAVEVYRSAREDWAAIAERTKGVYVDDVSFGIAWYQRGHWADRLDAIDRDIEAMNGSATAVAAPKEDLQEYERLIKAVMAATPRPSADLQHTPPRSFRRGQPVLIEIKSGGAAESVRLHYRRTNQAEPWQVLVMKREADAHRTAIPADYGDSPFPLQYYFELAESSPRTAVLYPGFNSTWSNVPYFVLRQA